MFNKKNKKMYYVNAYYAVIDDFITIYLFLEMALSCMIYNNKWPHNVQ